MQKNRFWPARRATDNRENITITDEPANPLFGTCCLIMRASPEATDPDRSRQGRRRRYDTYHAAIMGVESTGMPSSRIIAMGRIPKTAMAPGKPPAKT